MWTLLSTLAWALPELRLPAEEDPAAWADAAAIAGLGAAASNEGLVVVHVADGAWEIEAQRGSERRVVSVPAPTTAAAREDLLLLGVSLLRSLPEPPPGWGWLVEAAGLYVAPRSFGDQGFGGLVGGEARRGALGIELSARGVAPRRLYDRDSERWWLPVDARVGVGWRGEGQTRLLAGVEGGVSARSFGEPGGVVQVDWKPVVGGGAGVEHDLSARWVLRARAGLDVDLGTTRVEGGGEPFQLGLVELSLRVGVAWRHP